MIGLNHMFRQEFERDRRIYWDARNDRVQWDKMMPGLFDRRRAALNREWEYFLQSPPEASSAQRREVLIELERSLVDFANNIKMVQQSEERRIQSRRLAHRALKARVGKKEYTRMKKQGELLGLGDPEL